MSKPRMIALSASEKRIWEAAYAAAFVRLFFDQLADRYRANASANGAFDATLRFDHAEEAESVADAAVAQLRRFRREGQSPPHMTRGAPARVDTRWIREDDDQ